MKNWVPKKKLNNRPQCEVNTNKLNYFYEPDFFLMDTIQLIFENSSKFYFEGELVRMKLEIHLERPSILNNIVANFVGLSEFNVLEENNMKRKVCRNSREVYFDDVLQILIQDKDKEKTICPAGVKVFIFNYQLPTKIPTSIEASRGYVRYSVHIYMDIEGKTIKKTKYFSVISKTDLNENSSSHLPGVMWQPENQCILQAMICGGSHIRAFVHIAKQGYVPGECLFVNAEVSNFYRQPIEWVKASLVQILKYKNAKAFSEKRIVSEITRGCIMPFKTQTWRSESMLIPAIPPTSSKKLVTVKYKLLFQYKPAWKRKEAEMQQKIIIGTVRLVGCKQGRGEGEGTYSSEFFNASNLDSCIFGPHHIEENEDGEPTIEFSPVYPVYLEI